MFKPKTLYSLLAAGLFACSGVAHATVHTWDFGTLILHSNGYAAPNSFGPGPNSFATLVADDSFAAGTWQFTLTVNTPKFQNSFGASAYVQAMGFDYNPTPSPLPITTFVSSNVGGVTTAWTNNGGAVPPGFYEVDFRTMFGMNSLGRLQDGDYVTWNVSGLGASTLSQMFVRTGFVTAGDARFAKYIPIVPEPETYAMVLAGLGLLGFTARRRKNNNA